MTWQLVGSNKGPYGAPYRTLYSSNVSNLFMAGRDISVWKDAKAAISPPLQNFSSTG